MEVCVDMLRCHVRTLFGNWHLVALAAVLAALWAWPVENVEDRQFLAWFLKRVELIGPLVLMPMTGGVLLVDGRIDERWGVIPMGFGGIFALRWLLILGYFALLVGLVLAVGALRLGNFEWSKAFCSAVVSAAFFSAAGSSAFHLSGSPGVGWGAGLSLYFAAVVVSQFWCPYDSLYQLWLPFAGVSDADPLALLASKAGYGGFTLLIMLVDTRLLMVPERLLKQGE